MPSLYLVLYSVVEIILLTMMLICVSLNLQLPFWIRKRIVFCREPWPSYPQEAHGKPPNADDIRSHPRLCPACDRLLEHNKRGLSRSERIKAVKAYIGRDPLGVGVAHCRSRILWRTNGSEIRFPSLIAHGPSPLPPLHGWLAFLWRQGLHRPQTRHRPFSLTLIPHQK